MTIFLVVMMYGYIIHLYRSEKKGENDYERFGNIALDDEIDSKPVVPNPKAQKENEEQK